MQSVRYAIYCFANYLLCFQVKLDWLTGRAAVVQLRRSRWPDVKVFRLIASYSTRKSSMYTSRTLETFRWRAKEYLGALSLRNDAAEARFQVTAVWCCRHWPTCAKLRHIYSSGILYSGTLTRTSSLAINWSRMEIETWPTEPFPDSWRKMKSLGTRPETELNKGSYPELWLYKLKIKIQATYSCRLFVL